MIQLELETSLGKTDECSDSCSGKYAPAFTNKLHPCSVISNSSNAA